MGLSELRRRAMAATSDSANTRTGESPGHIVERLEVDAAHLVTARQPASRTSGVSCTAGPCVLDALCEVHKAACVKDCSLHLLLG